MAKQIKIEVTDGEKTFSCTVKRPDVATLSRVNKLAKADEVMAAQELLKGCWVEGDREIQEDGYLLMAAVGRMGELQAGVSAEIKN
ncbi:MAG: hypothetical protein LBJ17_01675 [Dysgonamonadaceae bacterium]|jgi:hypothetical protein|nr:hypothetical protein [Dysgonamonadaceae bacterium]